MTYYVIALCILITGLTSLVKPPIFSESYHLYLKCHELTNHDLFYSILSFYSIYPIPFHHLYLIPSNSITSHLFPPPRSSTAFLVYYATGIVLVLNATLRHRRVWVLDVGVIYGCFPGERLVRFEEGGRSGSGGGGGGLPLVLCRCGYRSVDRGTGVWGWGGVVDRDEDFVRSLRRRSPPTGERNIHPTLSRSSWG